ncbi:hypothetical protein R1sor_001747 [Riccia sorocarpa]|uniref:Protein kinase domain-containing protein n=1 Tax=Riccia sorocarpa TaxID=122646 RepID=A0ABD3H078_9MARC
MGCFFPKKQSKVAQGDHHQHGSKSDHLSDNQPSVLSDPDNVTGEQSSRGSQRKYRLTRWRRRSNETASQTGSSSGLSSKFPRALSVPHDYTFEDPASINGDGYNYNSTATAIPFSAPLPSRLPDITSSPSYPSNSTAVTHLSPSAVGTPSTVENGGDPYCGSLEKKPSFNERLDRKTFGGRLARLPNPLGAGHPLPLPYSPDRSEGGSLVMNSGVGSPLGASPSPSRGREAHGAHNHGLAGVHKSADARPLPPPALSFKTQSPVRRFSHTEFAPFFTPEFMLWDCVHGTAYRASVDDGNKKVEVAVVCTVAKSHQGQREWIAEVNWLARLQDPRLCKLIGYCAEDTAGEDSDAVPRGRRRLLAYEYMCNGSLERNLQRKADSQLEWAARMKIALDIAEGLAYLHDKAPFQVICRDLCPATVQLDKDLRAKLSGFGLARCGPEGDQGAPMVGPYAAPESSLKGVVTRKSNAWSFGVILLELLTGRRHMDPIYAEEQQNLIQLSKPYLRDRDKLHLIVDSGLNGRFSFRGSLKLANLAFHCLQNDASLRPNLREALEILKTLQVAQDAVNADLKKGRSFSATLTSPASYSRTPSQNGSEGKNSGEFQQRDGEGHRTIAASCSVESSPSYSELKPTTVDLKEQRDREFQRVPIQNGMVGNPAKGETTGRLNEPKQKEKQSQKVSTTSQSPPVMDSKKHLPNSKQIAHELRKLATGSRITGTVKFNNQDGHKLSRPQPLESVKPPSSRLKDQEAQKPVIYNHLVQSTESDDKREQVYESEGSCSTVGSVEEANAAKVSGIEKTVDRPSPQDELAGFTGKAESHFMKPVASTASSGRQAPEMQKAVRFSAANRASCAPALIFDPPILSQAF